ncbi:MAG: hypothetical protein CSB34_04755 [Desulfobulbus propionicus]|nr:MAG: hypothetical protein CSB34_04755 [Desulfobulbus propionicus]PIE66594.1 MAG: hypothetical protein CSA26_00155 [Desulfobacterales bacterium]
MATGSQQLVDDFEQLKSSLELYPKVRIVKTEGQPPENYEIEYALKGYVKEDDGSITIGSTHTVQISLPFGYPHFAPTVKPLSNIFHPDVDPAAIRIADKWQQNPSLPDLVLHIGEMISGQQYSLSDPFNQEAADWYKQQAAHFPLDSLSIAAFEEAGQDIDSLVDDTFASLGLESDDFLEPEKEFSPADVDHIQMLIDQKQLVAANQALQEISHQFPERSDFENTISRGLQKSEQMITLAEQLEDLGKLDEAIEVMDNLFDIATDAPGAETLRSRIQQAYALATSLKKSEDPGNELVQTHHEDTPQVPEGKDKKEKKTKAALPRPSLRINLPIRLLLVVTLLLAICIGGISLYFKDQNILSRSQANILKSQLLIDKRQFENAQETLQKTEKALSSLTILRFKKDGLKQDIEALLNSRELDEGLRGNVLYQGKYIPAGTAQSLKELATLTDQASSLMDQNKTADALILYRQAFNFAQANQLDDKLAALQETIKGLELEQTLHLAEKAELGKDWQAAAETYRQALELSSSLSDPKTAAAITSRLTAATFRHELDLSKKTFTQEQWKETIEKLEKAQLLIDSNPEAVSIKERKDLHRLLVNARLYSTLSSARNSYNNKEWSRAVDAYRNALSLLEDEKENFAGHLEDSILKIKKTIFMVELSTIQEQVLLAENQENLEKSLLFSKKIQSLIQASPFRDDANVAAVEQRINKQIKKKEAQRILNGRISWLEEHYEEIFRANYPTFRGSQLVSPKATLLRKVGSKSIFTLTCTEKSQGTSSRLELNYMYNEKTGKWAVYNGE